MPREIRRVQRAVRWILAALAAGTLVGAAASPGADPADAPSGTAPPAEAVGTPEPGPAVPNMAIEHSVVELDPLWAGKPIEPEWVLRNTGDAPLSIRIKGG